MTNILASPVLQGIKLRAADVVEKCRKSVGHHLDVYVSFSPLLAVHVNNPSTGYTPLLCTRLCIALSFQPWRYRHAQ